jgi:AbrB family looped-hinge helix DNA binding protein
VALSSAIDRRIVKRWEVPVATVTLSPKFQVVVPQDVRESMRLKPGQKFQVFQEDGQILLVPVVPMKRARGFARGIDTSVPRDKGDRV